MTYPFQSERLSYALVTLDDISDIHALHSSELVDRFNTLGIPLHVEETIRVVEGWIAQQQSSPAGSLNYVIREKHSNTFIGLIALKLADVKFQMAEVWFKLLPAQWHKGFATEALKSIIQYGFQNLNLHRIEGGCATGNKASAQVMTKAGMHQEGCKKAVLPLKSGWSDAYIFAILRPE